MHKKVKSIEAWATEKAEQKFSSEMLKLQNALQSSIILQQSSKRPFFKVSDEAEKFHADWRSQPTIRMDYLFSSQGAVANALRGELVAKWREEILADLVNKIEGIDDQLEELRNEINYSHYNR